jgi:hypothetical protein
VSAAAHEAGHSVACWLLNRRVRYVTLHDSGPLNSPHTIDELPEEPDRGDVSTIADDALVYAVGCLAAGEDPNPHGTNDHYFLRKLCESVAYSEAESQAFEAWVIERARSMVAHEHFKALHAWIVAALERDGELDEDDFEHEMQRADRRYRAQSPDPRPHRVPEKEPPMARTASPTLVQCRESVVAVIAGEEKVARQGDIYKGGDPLVKHCPELFVELGELPATPRYLPPAA